MKNHTINYTLFFKLLFIFLASIFVFLLCTLLRALPIGEYLNILYISSTVGFALYFEITYRFCKSYTILIPGWYIPLIVIGGFLLLQLPARIISFTETAVTLPEQSIHLIGILLGFFCYKGDIKQWLVWATGGVLIVWFLCTSLF